MQLLTIQTTLDNVKTAIRYDEIQYIICNVRHHKLSSGDEIYFTVEIFTRSGKTHICYFVNERARNKQFNYIIKCLQLKEVANEN